MIGEKPINDPLEREFMAILDRFHIRYERPERQSTEASNLDFYLPDFKLSCEVKSWSSERIHAQLRTSGKEQEGILLIIGIDGVRKFGELLEEIAEEAIFYGPQIK